MPDLTVSDVDRMLAQVAEDRRTSAYWQDRDDTFGDLDTVTAYLQSLRDGLTALCPDRPDLTCDEAGHLILPDGWTSVVVGHDPAGEDGDPDVVLAGWDTHGDFWQYAPTEHIIGVCRDAIEAAYTAGQEAPRA